MTREEWPEHEEETKDGECEVCETKGPVQYLPDPMIDEVYGEQTNYKDWCYECWSNRKDEV